MSKRNLFDELKQGLNKPNEQAITLLKLTEKFPDTLERLQTI